MGMEPNQESTRQREAERGSVDQTRHSVAESSSVEDARRPGTVAESVGKARHIAEQVLAFVGKRSEAPGQLRRKFERSRVKLETNLRPRYSCARLQLDHIRNIHCLLSLSLIHI